MAMSGIAWGPHRASWLLAVAALLGCRGESQELVERHLRAAGTLEGWLRYAGLDEHGIVLEDERQVGTFRILAGRPWFYREEIQVRGSEVILATDGNQALRKDRSGLRPLPAAERSCLLLRAALVLGRYLPAPKRSDLRRAPPSSSSAPALFFEMPGHPRLTLELDPDTALLSAVTGLPGPEGGSETWSDYAAWEAIRLVRRRERRMPDGRSLTLATHCHGLGHFPPNVFLAFDPPAPQGGRTPALRGSGDLLMCVHGGKVYVPARIADGPTLQLLVDSGAAYTLLKRSVVEGYPEVEGSHRTHLTLEGPVRASRVRVPSLRVGALVLPDARPYAAERIGEPDLLDPWVGGILGGEVFTHCVVGLDYVHRICRILLPSEFQPPPGARAVPLIMKDGLPFVRGRINEAHVDFLLDTGHPLTVAVKEETVRRARIEAARAAIVEVGGIVRRDVPVDTSFRGIGGHPVEAVAGGGWFSGLTVIFDLPGGRVFFLATR